MNKLAKKFAKDCGYVLTGFFITWLFGGIPVVMVLSAYGLTDSTTHHVFNAWLSALGLACTIPAIRSLRKFGEWFWCDLVGAYLSGKMS